MSSRSAMSLAWTWLALLGASQALGCSRYELAARWNAMRGDSYALDAISREVAPGAAISCPAEPPAIVYRGDVIAYQPPVQVAAPFAVKLRLFERAVTELAVEHYGRAPDQLLHYGARVCRTVRPNGTRLSEHALGNALDLAGFAWRRQRKVAGAHYPDAFTVSIRRHWAAPEPNAADARHHAFLHALLARIREQDLFRGVIGPGREGHADHLHLDQSPWSYWLF